MNKTYFLCIEQTIEKQKMLPEKIQIGKNDKMRIILSLSIFFLLKSKTNKYFQLYFIIFFIVVAFLFQQELGSGLKRVFGMYLKMNLSFYARLSTNQPENLLNIPEQQKTFFAAIFYKKNRCSKLD